MQSSCGVYLSCLSVIIDQEPIVTTDLRVGGQRRCFSRSTGEGFQEIYELHSGPLAKYPNPTPLFTPKARIWTISRSYPTATLAPKGEFAVDASKKVPSPFPDAFLYRGSIMRRCWFVCTFAFTLPSYQCNQVSGQVGENVEWDAEPQLLIKLQWLQDYFEIVKKPMDLSLIKRKLDTGQYPDPWQYVDDVWLMFDNAWLYNRKSSKVHKNCSKVRHFLRLVCFSACSRFRMANFG